MLDTDVVVEPFQMAEPGRGAGRMQVQRRRAVARQVNVMSLAKRRSQEKSRHAPAPRRIRLLHIHGTGIQHAAEIVDVVTILTGGKFHTQRQPFANGAHAGQVVG
jgi:hypothetical protein